MVETRPCRHPGGNYVLADFVCRIQKGVLMAGDDAGLVEWMAIAKLGSLLLTEGTKEVVDRVYEDYKRRNARV